MATCNPAIMEHLFLARPTLRDIAEHLGVSTATVSLAMRGNERISADTRRRVEEALEEFGYVYHRSAANLRTSMTHTVGVIVNDVSDPFFATLLAALQEALARAGRSVFLCHTNESASRQANFLRTMSEYNADGIIVSPAIGSTAQDFSSLQVPIPPVVFVSRTLFELGFDHVINDDGKAAQLAVDRLVSLGHRRIAFVGGDPGVSCFQLRLEGYREALERARIPFDGALVRDSLPSRTAGFEAARWVAELEPRPTAAICYNDPVALGLFSGLQREGLFPGRNFALIGHEDVEEASFATPPLSTTAVSRDEMGRTAAATLVRRIEDPDAPPRHVVLKPELIVRGTCGVRM